MLSFNNIAIIGICPEDLSKSTYKNMETIVLYCGSRDGSTDYIAKNFPWVKLVRFRKDPGADAAYTYVVRQAKGNYILLLSADVRIFPNTVADLVRNMQASSVDVSVPVCLDWEDRYSNAGLGWPFFNVRGYDLFGFLLQKLFSSITIKQLFYFIFACCLQFQKRLWRFRLLENQGLWQKTSMSYWKIKRSGMNGSGYRRD